MTYSPDSGPPQAPHAPQYAPPQYQAPQPPAAPRARGLALSALIVGIVAFLLGLLPFIGILLGIAGITLGIFALIKKQSKGMAITGLALASCALLASIGMTVSFANFSKGFDQGMSSANSDSSSEPAPEEPEVIEDEEPEPTPEPEPEEKEEAVEEPAAPITPDLSTFTETDDRTLGLIAKDPNASAGTNVVVYGTVFQFDNFTGKCSMMLNIGAAQADYSFEYQHNTYASAGDGISNCPALDSVVQNDNVKLWATVEGAYDYDTAAGGSATAIGLDVWQVELLPADQ